MATAQPLPFGHLLKRSRLAAGLTQEELAARASLGVRSISDLERGVRRTPYRDTIALLAEALGLSAAERAAFEAAARGQGTAPSHQSPAGGAETSARAALLPPLVGRAREVALIGRHLAGERPPVLLVAGEPGIGKTRLLQEAATRAAAHGWCVLVGGCTRRGAQEPYAPLLQALADCVRHRPTAQLRADLQGCAWLVRLLPELVETTLVPAPQWSLPPEQERRLMFAAVGRFLANVAGPAGTLLLLDDLQWAGADALDLLASLVRSELERPLRVVGAYRSTEVQPPHPLAATLADLAREGLATQRTLGPLPPPEAAHLLRRLLEDGATEDGAAEDLALRERVLERSGGVPYFLVSCAQALRAGLLDGGELAGEGAGVPWDVAQTIHQRVAALPPAAQELLAAAAVAGRVVPGALLVAVVGRPEDEVLAALEATCQARLLVEEADDVYQFAHDLIREVVAAALSTRRRKVLHRRVAEALEQSPGEPPVDLLAYHYAHSGDQEKAILYLERAGDRARALYAHAEAEAHYRELIERLEALGRSLEAARAREKLGWVLRAHMRFAEALAELAPAEEVYRRQHDLEGLGRVLAFVGLMHASQGTEEEGLAQLLPALPTLDQEQVTPQTRSRLYGSLAQLYGSSRYAAALAAAEREVALAQEAGDATLLGGAEQDRGDMLVLMGNLEAGRTAVEAAIPLLQAIRDVRNLAFALARLAEIDEMQGRFRHGLAHIEAAVQAATQSGHQGSLATRLSYRGRILMALGEWRQASTDFEEALVVVRGAPTSWLSAYPFIAYGMFRLATGAWDGAADLLGEAIRLAEQFNDLESMRMAQSAYAERDLLEGRATEALARLEPLCQDPNEPSRDVTVLLPLLAWVTLELGDQPRATSLLERAHSRASGQRMRPTLATTFWVQALLAMRQRHWPEAEHALEEALALARAMPYPYAEAKALYVYGQMHAAKGEPEPARVRLEAALAILNRLGERLYAAHIERAIEAIE